MGRKAGRKKTRKVKQLNSQELFTLLAKHSEMIGHVRMEKKRDGGAIIHAVIQHNVEIIGGDDETRDECQGDRLGAGDR